jgi:hypothetical protein
VTSRGITQKSALREPTIISLHIFNGTRAHP